MTPGSTDPGISGRVTVVCCDLKGSTALAERVDPESWRAVLNALLPRARGGARRPRRHRRQDHRRRHRHRVRWRRRSPVGDVGRRHRGRRRSLYSMTTSMRTWGLRIANRTGVATGVVADGDATDQRRDQRCRVAGVARPATRRSRRPLDARTARRRRRRCSPSGPSSARAAQAGRGMASRVRHVGKIRPAARRPATPNDVHESRRTVTIVFVDPAPTAASSSEPEAASCEP